MIVTRANLCTIESSDVLHHCCPVIVQEVNAAVTTKTGPRCKEEWGGGGSEDRLHGEPAEETTLL